MMRFFVLTMSCVALLHPGGGTARAAPMPGQGRAVAAPRLAGGALRRPNGRTAVTPPVITAGSILTPALSVTQAPAAPAISFTFKAPGYYDTNTFSFTNATGQGFSTGYGIPPPGLEKSGTIVFSNPLSPLSIFLPPGTYSLSSATLTDLAGNTTTYDAAQSAALFPAVTVTLANGGTPDITPPTVSAGKIDTRTISLSSAVPFFQVSLTAADNLSGIADIYLALNEPDGTGYQGTSFIEVPAQTTSGSFAAGALLGAGLPTGTWTIAGYVICDVAGNCLNQFDTATLTQQFGSLSFMVTP